MNGRTGELSYKPRPTRYGDVVFRSRLEARWAQIFDLLEIEWAYEPAGYLLDASWCPRLLCCGPEFTEDRAYLPDFYLPQSRVWVEVKGAEKNLRRGLAAWATSCLPSSIDRVDPIEWTTRRDRAASSSGGALLLLGSIPFRDRCFTLLSSRSAYRWDEPAKGDVHAYRVRLDSLCPSLLDIENGHSRRPSGWVPWNYLESDLRRRRRIEYTAPDGRRCVKILSSLDSNKVVTCDHGFDDDYPAGPAFAVDSFNEPWLELRPGAREHERGGAPYWSTVDSALKIARESQHQFEDAQFVEGRRPLLISAPRCAVDTSREDDDARDWQHLADAGAFSQ